MVLVLVAEKPSSTIESSGGLEGLAETAPEFRLFVDDALTLSPARLEPLPMFDDGLVVTGTLGYGFTNDPVGSSVIRLDTRPLFDVMLVVEADVLGAGPTSEVEKDGELLCDNGGWI